jgi:hypothetical protein
MATDITHYTGQSEFERPSAPGRKLYSFFRSILVYQEGEGRLRNPNSAGAGSGRPSQQPWFFLSHFPRRIARPNRGDRDPSGTAPAALSALRRADDFATLNWALLIL